MIVRPHRCRFRNAGSGLRVSRSGRPAGEAGRKSQTILPHSRPLHSKIWRATLLANSHVPSGTAAEAATLWIVISSRVTQAARTTAAQEGVGRARRLAVRVGTSVSTCLPLPKQASTVTQPVSSLLPSRPEPMARPCGRLLCRACSDISMGGKRQAADDDHPCDYSPHRRSVPLTAISMPPVPHREHTSRACQTGTAISAP